MYLVSQDQDKRLWLATVSPEVVGWTPHKADASRFDVEAIAIMYASRFGGIVKEEA